MSKMMVSMSLKRLLTIFLIVFSTFSFIKLLIMTNSSTPAAPHRPLGRRSTWDTRNSTAADVLADKEYALLRNLVAGRSPCRLLVFGLTPQLLGLAGLNAAAGGGDATVFLDDGPRWVAAGQDLHGATIHRVSYAQAAGEAYALLRHARAGPACRRPSVAVRASSCRLALTRLPRAVLEEKWDVIIVDGPSGAGPGEPGRMGAIYTAAAMARASAATAAGGAVDVALHDVHRTVERWYAWEYLCDENLVAAKGRLWHFRIRGGSSEPDGFCSKDAVKIL